MLHFFQSHLCAVRASWHESILFTLLGNLGLVPSAHSNHAFVTEFLCVFHDVQRNDL